MKKFLLLLLLLPLASADPLEAESVTVSLKLSNIIELDPTSSNHRVESVKASLSWIPRETYRQYPSSVLTEPESKISGDELDFEWAYPKERQLWINLASSVTTTSDYFEIKSKTPFPLRELDQKVGKYLEEQKIIDFSPEIKKQASELAEGKDDLYEVVLAIASWVNQNIDYSLDTLTAEASQKSSWVLQNKRGVCDELTSLFISMLRSLGVPARFVYGEAYTNTGQNKEDWGPHGWAEIYFPKHGWVPFDPTYGQYGYVDAGHVKMGDSKDARRPSLKYKMKATNFDINSGFLDIRVTPTKESKPPKPKISLSAEFYNPEVGIGSYNLLTVTVKNEEDYYKPVSLKISFPREVSAEEDSKILLLKPKSEKKAHFLLKVQDDLKQHYVYTFPTSITTRGVSYNASFKARKGKEIHERSMFEEIVYSAERENRMPYSKNVGLECVPSQDVLYVGEEVNVDCKVTNSGSKNIKAKTCYEECQEKIVDQKGTEIFSFKDSYEEPGTKNFIVTVEGKDFKRTGYSRVKILDDSKVIINIEKEDSIEYGETTTISFSVEKESDSTPKNLEISFGFQGNTKIWRLDELDSQISYDIIMDSKSFTFNNHFYIRVEYEDELGKKYSSQKEFDIKVDNKEIIDTIIVSLNAVGYWILTLLS